MFKKLMSQAAGAVIGGFSGIFLGLGLGVSLLLRAADACNQQCEDNDSYADDDSPHAAWGPFGKVLIGLVVLPVFLVVGILGGIGYGVVAGAKHGCQKGLFDALKKGIFSSNDEQKAQPRNMPQEKSALLAEVPAENVSQSYVPVTKGPFFSATQPDAIPSSVPSNTADDQNAYRNARPH